MGFGKKGKYIYIYIVNLSLINLLGIRCKFILKKNQVIKIDDQLG